MLPVNCGSHSDYQNFVVTNLRKYYPNPDSIARSTWDIIFIVLQNAFEVNKMGKKNFFNFFQKSIDKCITV